MTLEEFKKMEQGNEDYAPGWDAIDEAFSKVYPARECDHFATIMTARSIFGGDQWLDGYSIYTSKKGYKHIITYGMTELYFNEELFGSEYNKWGYEMTIKLAETDNIKCMWAIDMLGNLARYTNTQERYFEPYQYIVGNKKSICRECESLITALISVEDTEIEGVDTVYGRTDFIQLVGIMQQELEVIIKDPEMAITLIERMKEDNPDLVTDLNRTQSYL